MVTEANRLKRAGILDSFGQSTRDDSCTVTTYAFRNEITVVDNEPDFCNRQFIQIRSERET